MRANRLLLILFLLLAAALYFLPVFDTDFGWHYRCGVDLLAGQPCLSNTYSYYLAGYQWAYPSFLYDAAVAVVFDRAGFLGLSVVGSLLFAGVAAVVWFGSRLPKMLTIVGFLLAAALSWSVLGLGLRSQLVTLLMTLLTISLLGRQMTEDRRRVSVICYLLSAFLVWTNAHGGFFLGPVLVGLWGISSVIRRDPSTGLRMTTLVALTIIVTFINPFGWQVWAEVWRHFQMPLNTLIAEWVGPPWWHWVIIGALDLLYLWLAQKSKWSIFSLLTLGLMTVLALSARRNLPLYYFSYLLLFPRQKLSLKDLLGQTAPKITDSRKQIANRTDYTLMLSVICFLLTMVLIAGYVNIPRTLQSDTSWGDYCSSGYQKYPCEATSFLKTRPPGNVYSAFEWGGFLIWQLPQSKVFVDGRTPAWTAQSGESPYTTYLKIIQAQEGWDLVLTQYHTDYLLIPQGSFLDILLQEEAASHGYQEEYRDPLAVVYEKSPASNYFAGRVGLDAQVGYV